jgi:hypothetical protein
MLNYINTTEEYIPIEGKKIANSTLICDYIRKRKNEGVVHCTITCDIKALTQFLKVVDKPVNELTNSDIHELFDYLNLKSKGTAKNNATNLTDQELKVLKFTEGKPATIQNLMHFLNVSIVRVMQILNGKDGKSDMLAKVPQLNKIDRSEIAFHSLSLSDILNSYCYSNRKIINVDNNFRFDMYFSLFFIR